MTEDGLYNPKMGTNKLAEYSAMFGLDSVSGIELTESPPSLPGNTTTGYPNPVTAAMGQEFNSYTPTQIARFLATLANGGTLYELTLIDRIYNSDGSVYEINEPTVTQVNDFDEETIELVHQGMIDVTSGSRGTARRFYANFPILVAGKTGSAQENKSRASHAVFGSFAPANDPEIAIAVVIPFSYTANFSSGYIVGTLTVIFMGHIMTFIKNIHPIIIWENSQMKEILTQIKTFSDLSIHCFVFMYNMT